MGNFFIVPPPFPSLLILPRKWETFLSLSNSPGVAGVTRKRREKEDRKAAFAHRRERRKKCGTSALGWYVWCRHSLAGESPPFPPDPASHMRILPIFENAHGTLIPNHCRVLDTRHFLYTRFFLHSPLVPIFASLVA